MITEINFIGGEKKVEVKLPASKSISNRVLIIEAISGKKFSIKNLSEANDTAQLHQILSEHTEKVDAGEGGTTLRFLLAYYCLRGVPVEITAADVLKKRPITILIDALRSLGASVDYLETDGKLPLRINGGLLTGNQVSLPGDISSQFISALMMIGPYIKGGLRIDITGEVLSLPYILMTKSVMEYFGAKVKFDDQVLSVDEGKYMSREITIEPDWSAASYWYEIAALGNDMEIFLPGLVQQSLQGDAAIYGMMESFGVQTRFTETGAWIAKDKNFDLPDYFTDDFSGCPDLGPAVAAVCAGLNITADLKGLKNFRLKESDRAAALQRELYNMNVKTDFCGGSKFKIYQGAGLKKYDKPVKTYTDHRIAMAMAPLALLSGKVVLDDGGVVKKSYPGYFDDLKKSGFQVTTKSEMIK